jgi:hypothetical protein
MNKSFYLKILDKILSLFNNYKIVKAHYLLDPSQMEGFRKSYHKIELLQAFNEVSKKKNRCYRGFRNTTSIQLQNKEDKEVERLTANNYAS